MHRSVAALAAAAAVAVSTPASAIVIGSGSGSDSAYRALANYYPSVGQISGAGPNGGFAASGVVIAPNWVLTAGHVVSGAKSLTFYLDGGGDFSSFGARSGIAATDWVTYPSFDGHAGSGYDLGLIHFATDFSVDLGIDPATLYTGRGEIGAVGTMVGYGTTGRGSTGGTRFDGLKRAGRNAVDAAAYTPGGGNRILLGDFDSGAAGDNSYGSSDPLAMEAMIAPGDSGGGLFVPCGGPSAADDCLAGITSFAWGRLDGDPNSDFGDVQGFTRVSSFLTWIDGYISPEGTPSPVAGGVNLPRTYGLRLTDAAVPEPASAAILGAGLVALGVGRRRARRSRR